MAIEKAQCPECRMSVEGPWPASIRCHCGTVLRIHGGGPDARIRLVPDPPSAPVPSSLLGGGRDYA
jgi:hypothetical protein